MDTNIIHTGDCFDVLPELPDESVHAVVSDPPYGLAFMGRDWDDFEPKEYQEWCEQWARECLRVLKPGGHLLAFSGNRTHHRLFTGVEDAGFEIRDTLTWHYGSGFPKASDISKTIDKRRDESDVRKITEWLRTRIDQSDTSDGEIAESIGVTKSQVTSHWAAEPRHKQPQVPSWEYWTRLKELVGFGEEMDDAVRYLLEKGTPGDGDHQRDITGQHPEPASEIYRNDRDGDVPLTAPATDAAKKWDGWKTGLKPSTEFVVMARKPYDGAAVDCVLEHGTGALNIEACRVGLPDSDKLQEGIDGREGENIDTGDANTEWGFKRTNREAGLGRYPANLMFDEVAAEQLDNEVGELEGPWGSNSDSANEDSSMFNLSGGVNNERWASESGGPSRFFYTSKATKAERTLDGKIDNAHPTVKPTDLMEWLVKLVTAENQIVLDPFCGSGTTCMAAKNLNRQFIGIERQDKWADVARVRVGLTPNDPSVVRGDTNQNGLESYL